MPTNRDFDVLLTALHFKHEFHTVRGSHNWNQWNAWLPTLFQSLEQHMNPKD